MAEHRNSAVQKNRRRSTVTGLLVAVALIAAAAVAAIGYRHDMASFAIRRALAEAGLSPVELRVEQANLKRLVLTGLRAGADGNIHLDRLDVTYVPQHLLEGRIESVFLDQLKIAAEVTPSGLTIDGVDAGTMAKDGETGKPWIVEHIEIDDASVQLTGLIGAEFTLDGEIMAAGEDGYRGEVRLTGAAQMPHGKPAEIAATLRGATTGTGVAGTLRFDVDGVAIADPEMILSSSGTIAATYGPAVMEISVAAPMTVDADTPGGPVKVRIEPSDTPLATVHHQNLEAETVTVHLAEADVTALDRRLSITDSDIAIALHHATVINISELHISDLTRPRLLPPLEISGEAVMEGGKWPFEAHVSAADGRVLLEATGAWDTGHDRGDASIKMQPARFEPGGLQPGDVVPALKLPVSEVAGRVSAGGTLKWRESKLQPDIRLHVQGGAMEAAGMTLQEIDGTFRLTGLDPLRLATEQAVTIGRIDAGVEMTDAQIRFAMPSQRRIGIQQADVKLLEGSVSQSGAVLSVDPIGYRGSINIAGISLQALLETAGLNDAQATGQVSGRVPLIVEGGALRIDEGHLVTDAPGVLRYTPERPPEALEAQGQGMGLAMQALENFHYNELSVAVDGGPDRGWSSRVRISGKNPDFMEGYPFVFNINLSGDLYKAVMSGLFGMTLPDRIQEELNRK